MSTLDRARAIFDQASRLSAPEREVLISEECAADSRLAALVRGLLAEYDAAPATGPAVGPVSSLSTPAPLSPGAWIGQYRLVRVLGTGGFGTVYLADQQSPVRRQVALKLISPGMHSRLVIARFEDERQALAMMSHPHIAKVFDAGTTEHGLPFFVMEYVDGEPLTRYCDRHRLSVEDRLRLFVPVCEAVQHAHAKRLIHRDIKPNNILVEEVDGKASPKVIDFGIAKALDQESLEHSQYTEKGLIIGTPEYMSPEQASGGEIDIDTRTDVYSLGVVLYELLTGLTPFDGDLLRSKGWNEMLRIIREDEPPAPSSRLLEVGPAAAQLAHARRTEARSLGAALKSELEWIPQRAMRKERDRRYAGPLELARDIDNYLRRMPLTAGPESVWYLISKSVRRHRGALSASVAILLVLVAGLAASLIALERARAARAAKLSAVQEANRSSDVLGAIAQLLAAARPDQDGRTVTVYEVMSKAGPFAEQSVKDPLARAAINESAGVCLWGLRQLDEAEPRLREALRLRELAAPDSPATIDSALELGGVLRDLGRLEEAQRLLERGVTDCRRVRGEDDPNTLSALATLGALLDTLRQHDKSLELFRDLLPRAERVFGPTDDQTVMIKHNLARLLLDADDLLYAEQLLDEVRSVNEQSGDKPGLAHTLHSMGLLRARQGRQDDARKLLEQSKELFLQLVGPEADWTRMATASLEALNRETGSERK